MTVCVKPPWCSQLSSKDQSQLCRTVRIRGEKEVLHQTFLSLPPPVPVRNCQLRKAARGTDLRGSPPRPVLSPRGFSASQDGSTCPHPESLRASLSARQKGPGASSTVLDRSRTSPTSITFPGCAPPLGTPPKYLSQSPLPCPSLPYFRSSGTLRWQRDRKGTHTPSSRRPRQPLHAN